METSGNLGRVAGAARRLSRLFLCSVENRVELFAVELQEERERLTYSILLALGIGVLSLLAGMTLTFAVVVLLWDYSRVGALLAFTAIYGGGAWFLYARLAKLRREWQSFPATLDQLRKDRECLDEMND